MYSRERILAAIDYKEPEGLPVDLGATPSSGISAIAYCHRIRHMGYSSLPTIVCDVMQELAQPDDRILDYFQTETVDIGRTFNEREMNWVKIKLLDGPIVEFPAWFRPVVQPDGTWDAMDGEGERIATYLMRWGKYTGLAWYTARRITPPIRIFGSNFASGPRLFEVRPTGHWW